MRNLIFFSLLVAVTLICWRRGRTDERVAAVTCVVGTVMTIAATLPMSQRFASFHPATFAIDLAVLAAFLWIALRSERFWPMWVAGLQLTATTVHLLKILDPDLMRFVFGAALAFWSYPIVLLIGIGAWRTTAVERWRSRQRLPDGT